MTSLFFVRFFFFVLYPIMVPSGSSDRFTLDVIFFPFPYYFQDFLDEGEALFGNFANCTNLCFPLRIEDCR